MKCSQEDLEYQRNYRKLHPEKVKASNIRQYKKNRDKDIARVKAQHAVNKERVVTHYCNGNPHCQCPSGKCNITNIKFLTVDHPNNDGMKLRKVQGFGSSFYRWIIRNNFPPGFRILCWNCNSGREKNGGICPHEE
jgi:hypothetical protein